ncbi:hypothetical protein [Arenicella xantha]|uniref:Uncharacterized protein n=1 Tax=Arenicella xantha TaxID=644221 RepID=A0A395JK80_9GAMM|nr:hypothetical protein [Arenicella xantha]RBP51091.1 hypothetical protein DFR28_102510 [Arenicella xantha]
MPSPETDPNILILEDDLDQMELLVDFTLTEIKELMNDKSINEAQRQKLKRIRIIKVSNIKSLQTAASMHKNVILAVLDCNSPDSKGGEAHDQLVKTNHVITGQHKAVDIVTEELPDTPITMISSLDRFRTIINRYYESNFKLSINFIPKTGVLKIKENVELSLRKYLNAAN